jgi:small-conductance mechanosensitive channel
MGFIIAIASLGIDLTKFAIFASALGIGIGFGLQNLISNFSAGLILLFDKTLKVGDFVELESGVTGEVKDIAIRSTVVTTNDNIDIIVPNSEFINFRVTNWTMRDTFRRLKVRFGVAYNSDKELVRKAVLEAADRVKFTLKDSYHKSPQVWLRNFGDNALEFDLVVWLTADAINRPSAVQAAYMWEIHSSLLEYGIEIPFPQRDLHVRSWSAEAVPPAAPASPTDKPPKADAADS